MAEGSTKLKDLPKLYWKRYLFGLLKVALLITGVLAIRNYAFLRSFPDAIMQAGKEFATNLGVMIIPTLLYTIYFVLVTIGKGSVFAFLFVAGALIFVSYILGIWQLIVALDGTGIMATIGWKVVIFIAAILLWLQKQASYREN